jgi:hypothetical protein
MSDEERKELAAQAKGRGAAGDCTCSIVGVKCGWEFRNAACNCDGAYKCTKMGEKAVFVKQCESGGRQYGASCYTSCSRSGACSDATCVA